MQNKLAGNKKSIKQGTTVRATKDWALATTEHCLTTSKYLNEQKCTLFMNHQGHLSLQYNLVPQNHASIN